MIRVTMSGKTQLLTVLGLSCMCAFAGAARSASPNELGGGLTAYRFDGVYKGDAQRVAGEDQSCNPDQKMAVEVREGRVKLAWHEPQVFDARIMRDGRFYATTGSLVRAEKSMTMVPTLQGRIDAAGLVADYGTRWCRYRLAASLPPIEQHLTERTLGVGAHQ